MNSACLLPSDVIQFFSGTAAHELSDFQFGFRGCLADVNQYLLMADNLNGSDRWMLSQLSTKLCRSLGRGDVSSTMDSGPGQAETQDKARRFVPSAAGPEETNTAKANVLKPHSPSKSRFLQNKCAQKSPGTKQAMFAAASARKETSSSCKTFHPESQRDEGANMQHVWRPW